MKRVVRLVVALAVAGAVALAHAQTPTPGVRNALDLPIDPASLTKDLPELKGVVSWRVLGQVRSAQVGSRIVPEFAPAVRALDKQEVKLQGFMLPLVTGEAHDHFLLTMRPPHCPFCLSLGPEYIVEVRAARPIRHTYEPIVLAGRFSVLNDDPFGLYYRLTAAQLAGASRP